MIFVLKNESMYLLNEKKIIVFQELLKANRYLSTYLTDFKYGYSVQPFSYSFTRSLQTKNMPHLLYQYTYGRFMFITLADGMMLFHSFMNAEETLTIINAVLRG